MFVIAKASKKTVVFVCQWRGPDPNEGGENDRSALKQFGETVDWFT